MARDSLQLLTRQSKTQLAQQELSPEFVQEEIVKALMSMAVFRGALAPESYLETFSQRLSREYLPGVIEACRRLGERPVREGEKALPDLGTILAARPIRDTWE